MSNPPSSFPFCKSCIAAGAEELEQAIFRFPMVVHLRSESHNSIKIRQCPDCSVKWVSVFEEMFSTTSGDSQYYSLVPIHDDEALELAAPGAALTTLIEKFGSNRRWLQMDYPAEKDKRVRWIAGRLAIYRSD